MTRIPFDRVRRDGGTQMRVTMSEEHIADLHAALVAGATLPPIAVTHDEEQRVYWVTDGFHRCMAYALLTPTPRTLEAVVTRGTQEDAVWTAAASNAAHGLKRTQDDKRLAVRAALSHRQTSETDMSDREVALHCGVSHTFVASVRADMEATRPSTGNVASSSEPKPRKGRDGKVRKLPKPPKVPPEARAQAMTAPAKGPIAAVGLPSVLATMERAGTIEISGGSNRDARDAAIPDALGETWQRLTARATTVYRALQEARGGVASLKTLCSSHPRALTAAQRDALHDFGATLDALMVRAEGYRPHAVCVACDGAGCSRCKARGWISRQEHEAIARATNAHR